MSTTYLDDRVWWSTRFDGWGVAPTISDFPEKERRDNETGWRAVLRSDTEPVYCRRKHEPGRHIETTARVFTVQYGWQALALLEGELEEANR